MKLYQDLKKTSFIISLKLSVPLMLFSLMFGGTLFAASAQEEPVMLGVALGSLIPGLFGIYRMVYALCGGYQSRIRGYIKKAPDSALTAQQLEQACAAANPLNRICIAGPWVLIQKGPATHLYETQEILWVYQQLVTRQRGAVAVWYHSLVLGMNDGQLREFRMPKWACEQCIAAFRQSAPAIIRGYSDKISRLYIRNIAEVLHLVRHPELQANLETDEE